MFLKNWLNIVGSSIASRKRNQPRKASLSLSSPKGTAGIRKKQGILGTFLRHAKHNEDFASLVLVMAIFFSVILVFVIVVAARGHDAYSPTEPNHVISPRSLLSRFADSSGHTRRFPKGYRYFDYWQDGDFNDNDNDEAYPWKFMKRPLVSSKTFGRRSLSSLHREKQTDKDASPMDDESYVPNPTVIHEHKEVVYNDRSPFYTELRNSYESFFPPPTGEYDSNAKRALQAVQDLQTYRDLQTHLSKASGSSDSESLYYDIYDCPEYPPEGYPVEWNLVHEVLSQWPADDPELPASGRLHQGLCVFDFMRDLQKALNYRNAEVPFVVRGDPKVAQTVERWNAPGYLNALLGEEPQGVETSSTGIFTYWTQSGVDQRKYRDFHPPTKVQEMTFGEWLKLANVTDSQLLTPESPHYYFKVVGCAPGKSRNNNNDGIDQSCSRLPGNAPHVPYLADELPFYSQTESSLYVKEPLNSNKFHQTSKALNCRFGMKGVMATNHFDGERNFVTVLSGERRYVLAHPNQCGNMGLFPYGHPSARHSAVDWARPNLQDYPEFRDARGNEVVLQAGDSLFLPSLWFHYIVSMSTNVQCNTRSGMDQRNVQALDDSCGW